MSKIFDTLLYRINSPQLNLISTLIVNFKLFPFRTALKLPIFVYGKTKIYSLNGTVTIEAPIQTGMIKFGVQQERFSANSAGGLIDIMKGSKVVFGGGGKILCFNRV